jgi:flagellin
MTVINTNTAANITANALTKNERAMSQAMERLSTGQRINSASDDAAGLAISSRMTSQINGLNMAVRNTNDAISMVQTADGALIEVTGILQRMRELAIQAASDTMGSTDRSAVNTEFEALREEITRIAVNTQFNGAAVFGQAANSTKAFQVGANASQTISVVFGNFNAGVTDGTAGLSGNTASTASSKFLALDEDGTTGSTTDDIVDQDLLSASNAKDATYIMDSAITAVPKSNTTLC